MSRYANSVPQILDGNGDPIEGAQKFFFETGTSTLKTVYTDSSFTTEQSNPVLSDANGRFPDIFIDGVYREVQKDANGVTLWTRDPVGEVSTGPMDIWTSDATYNIPDIVQGSDDEYYRSIIDSNQGNDPTTSAASWELLRFSRVWNAAVTYSGGDRAYGSDDYEYTSLVDSNLNNNPVSSPLSWSITPLLGHILTKSAAYTVELKDRGTLLRVTGTTTITMLPVATAGQGFNGVIYNAGSGVVTVDGDSGETVNGVTDIDLDPGQSILYTTTGATGWTGPVTGINASLTSLSALGTAADKMAYATALDTWEEADITAFARTILDDADDGTVRTTLGLGALAVLSSVSQSEIDSNAVGQAELKDALQQSTASVGASSTADINFTGGAYTLGWGLADGVSVNQDFNVKSKYAGTTYAWSIGVENTVAATRTYYFQARYFTATKPHNLGDGEIPLFVYIITEGVNVVGADVSPEPPWYYNGPNRIDPKKVRNDRTTGKNYIFESALLPLREWLMENPSGTPTDWMTLKRLDEPTEIEIDFTRKNRDMPLIPHPFNGHDLTGRNVFLLDPVSDIMQDLLELQEDGENISSLITDGYIIAGNEMPNRSGPPGVNVMNLRWRNTP